MKTTRTVSIRALAAAFLFTTLASTTALAQGSRGGGNNGSSEPLPLEAERHAKFTATEATWMTLDLSPDGQTIEFDLLGDL